MRDAVIITLVFKSEYSRATVEESFRWRVANDRAELAEYEARSSSLEAPIRIPTRPTSDKLDLAPKHP